MNLGRFYKKTKGANEGSIWLCVNADFSNNFILKCLQDSGNESIYEVGETCLVEYSWEEKMFKEIEL